MQPNYFSVTGEPQNIKHVQVKPQQRNTNRITYFFIFITSTSSVMLCETSEVLSMITREYITFYFKS